MILICLILFKKFNTTVNVSSLYKNKPENGDNNSQTHADRFYKIWGFTENGDNNSQIHANRF